VREPVDAARVEQVMAAFGDAAGGPTRVYFAGGATAVLYGWRQSTIDIDFRLVPEDDGLQRAIPGLKERLHVNLETASPSDFIPVPSGWEERSPLIRRIGQVSFHHLDPYTQALAKIERGHDRDRVDVDQMLARGLVEPDRLRRYFDEIEPRLYRFPAIDPPSFRRALDATIGRFDASRFPEQ
jgi:uncharacterized nucleotidyltransferase DUF6036